MLSILKPLFMTIVFLVIVTLLVVVIGPMLVPQERYHTLISESVKKHTGRDAIVDGEVSLTLFPTFSLRIPSATILDPQDAAGTKVVKVNDIHVDMDLRSLLSNKLEAVVTGKVNEQPIHLDFAIEDYQRKGSRREMEARLDLSSEEVEATVTGHINADLEHKSIAVRDLFLDMSDMPVRGNIAINYAPAVPQVEADFVMYTLDIPHLKLLAAASPVRPSNTAGAVQVYQPEKLLWSRKAFDASGIRKVNGTVTMRADRVYIDPNTHLGATSLRMDFKDGLLKNDIKTELLRGKAEVKLDIDVSQQGQAFIRASGLLSDLQLEPLLEASPLRRGIVRTEFDVSSRGNSLYDIVHNLNGRQRFQMLEGMIERDRLLQYAKGANIVSLLLPPKKNAIELSDVNGTVTIQEGIFTNQDLVINSPDLVVNGRGQMRLTDLTLNYEMTPRLVDPTTGAKTQFQAPFQMVGHVQSPEFRVSTEKLIINNLLNYANQPKKEEVQLDENGQPIAEEKPPSDERILQNVFQNFLGFGQNKEETTNQGQQ